MKHSRPEDPSVQQRRQRPSARGLYSDTDSAVYHITWHRDPLLRFAANLEEGHWTCLFDLVGKAKPGGGPACVYFPVRFRVWGATQQSWVGGVTNSEYNACHSKDATSMM